MTRIVSKAVILAAGNGDRFHNPTHDSKLLQPLLGRPLLQRTLEAAYDAGIRAATVVLGYQADRVRGLAEAAAPRGMDVSFALNPEWRLENGVSALAARASVGSDRFALLMGDHVFEPPVLQRMLRLDVADGESLLAVDARPVPPEIADEATKVRRVGSRIVAIGKDLIEYDALDTGVFVFSPVLFEALTHACGLGDTTLSGGVRELASRGLMRGVEIGDATWCDIDTLSDLAAAESALGAPSA
ncbi:MAG TPA: NTP transferase domain-containing protein [Vicinamibacterales bacterium]|nr:NTP transferase domain-containing protein [Vicinamibacterales bacterium]